jgi:hypothetical protein
MTNTISVKMINFCSLIRFKYFIYLIMHGLVEMTRNGLDGIYRLTLQHELQL